MVSGFKFGFTLVILGASLAFGLKAFSPELPQTSGMHVLSVSTLKELKVGERFSVYGGLQLPEGRFEKRFRICQVYCRTSGWGAVEGPGEWWGYIGALEFSKAGIYNVSLVLYAPWGLEASRAVAEVSWQVSVE